MSRRVATVFPIFMESRESCLAADGRAWKVDGRAQALVGPGLATPLDVYKFNFFPRIVPLWNKLPDYAISAANFDLFNQYLNCII